ncbi:MULTISPECIES: CAP domain-containing protein [Niastella]|uniref:CAP domain-containing protein n=1 Tax=Niastella soli TaxID=2821487 RepID=A0ABS3YV09_9BACT|nr:CAP domain-containing protein [Niastella soli]MBO9201755.1 CAP domain-containing protein [Niastella soli]
MKRDMVRLIGSNIIFISIFLTIAGCKSSRSTTTSNTAYSSGMNTIPKTAPKAGSTKPADVAPEKKVVVTPTTPVVEANPAPGMERDILGLVNDYRKSKKLPPLENNAAMEYQARRHSMDMGTHRIPFGHQGFSFRMKYVMEKVPGSSQVGENVAYGNLSASAVVNGWIKSPEHRKNMEGNFKYTGIGVTRNMQNQLYFTQLFAK